MYILKTEASFDSAHFLAGYDGKCSNLHGHRWKIIVEVSKEELSNEIQTRGMVVDFGTLKSDLRQLADQLDHALIIEKDSLKPLTLQALIEEGFRVITFEFRPTAENFSKYIYDEMQNKGYPVKQVVVYETPENGAAYEV